MKLGFVIYRYFPYGGQQRNMLNMAFEALARGHEVTVLCTHWQGEIPEGLIVKTLPVSGWGNHQKMMDLSRQAEGYLKEHPVDLVVGFVKLPGLDAYYAADPCFAEKAYNKRGWLYRLSPRTRTYLAFEEAVFGANSNTHILEVSSKERASFITHYKTPEPRFHTLVPGISPNRKAPDNAEEIRLAARQNLGFTESDCLLLALGSGFRSKGLDRSIQALAYLHRQHKPCHLLVVGQDKEKAFRQLASKEGVADYVHFLGGRDDVPAMLQAADVLVHPAYRENTGNVLLEAMIAGLPVIATETCGYAHYIEEADMGQVLGNGVTASQLGEAVMSVLSIARDEWLRRGKLFAEHGDIYRRPQQAVDILESLRVGQ